MNNYIFKRTDPRNTNIVVSPYTANGHSTPASAGFYRNPLNGISAVNASTSLILTGKGVPEYGEMVQNNLIYLAENFAGPTRPRQPMQGQLWYKNTAVADSLNVTDPIAVGLYIWNSINWIPVVLNSATSAVGDLNIAGSRIVNLGNPTSAGDAINLGYSDGRYVALSGSKMIGSLVLNKDPIIPLEAATKQYVDNIAVSGTYLPTLGGTLSGSFGITNSSAPGAPVSTFSIAAGAIVTIGTNRIQHVGVPIDPTDAATKLYTDNTFVHTSNGTAQGALTVANPTDPAASSSLVLADRTNFTVAPGVGIVDFGNRVISHVAVPIALTDVANKGYVDNSSIHKIDGSAQGTLTIANPVDPLVSSTLVLDSRTNFTVTPGAGLIKFGSRRVTLVGTPIDPSDATTKQYVDSSFLSVIGGQINGKVTIVDPLVPTNNNALILNGKVALTIMSGSGIIDFGARRITNLGAPSQPSDAVNKAYVDANAGTSTPSITLVSGMLGPTGVLSLNLSNNSSVIVAGQFAAKVHKHIQTDIIYADSLNGQSYIGQFVVPNAITFGDIVPHLDEAAYLGRAKNQRHIMAGDGISKLIVLPFQSGYLVGSNRLDLYIDGLKKVASQRGSSRINIATNKIVLGLPVQSYNVTMSLNGDTPFTYTINTNVGDTYYTLADTLNLRLSGSPVPSSVATSGYAAFTFNNIVGINPTGFANDATAYTASIVIDGMTKPISITGSTAQTVSSLLTQINTALGTFGSISINSRYQLRVTSTTTGATSVVLINDTDLFSSIVGFLGEQINVPGAAININYIPSTLVRYGKVRVEVYPTAVSFILDSNLSGVGSAATISFAPGELFTSIPNSTAPVNTSITVDMNYNEVGIVNTISHTVNLKISQTLGQVYEFITHP